MYFLRDEFISVKLGGGVTVCPCIRAIIGTTWGPKEFGGIMKELWRSKVFIYFQVFFWLVY